jgi:hypothetical protein
MARLLDAAVEKLVPGLKDTITLFTSCVEKVNPRGITLHDGFEVDMNYYRGEVISVRVEYGGLKMSFTNKLAIDEVHKGKIGRSAFVNAVHSIDAIHIRLIIMKCHNAGIKCLPLHDCLVFNLRDYDLINNIPMVCYQEMYRDGKIMERVVGGIDKTSINSIIDARQKIVARANKNAGLLNIGRNCFKLNISISYSTLTTSRASNVLLDLLVLLRHDQKAMAFTLLKGCDADVITY